MPNPDSVFFSNGNNKASFHSSGKTPDERDPLIIFIRAGKSSSEHSFTIVVGTRSSEHDLVGASTINFLIDASSRRSNSVSDVGHCEDTRVELTRITGAYSYLISVSNSPQMSVIFLTKNDPMHFISEHPNFVREPF